MSKILGIFTGLSLVVILLGINRGFDFSDEGLYLLMADPHQQNLGGIFNYDLFFKLFCRVKGFEFVIFGMRILPMILYTVAAFSLTLFWKK